MKNISEESSEEDQLAKQQTKMRNEQKTSKHGERELISSQSTDKLIHDQGIDSEVDEEGIPKKRKHERDLSTGDFFGELSLLYDCKRTCTI